ALHRVALARDQRAGEAVVAAALAADEAVRVGVDRERGSGADAGAVGIADARVGVAPGLLRLQRQRDGAFGVDVPGMPGIELAQVARHQRRVGEAGSGIVFGVARDRAGLGHGRGQALLAQVGGAGAALALAEVHGDRDAAVARGFDRLDLAHAHVRVEAAILAARDLGLGRAGRAAALEQLAGDVF